MRSLKKFGIVAPLDLAFFTTGSTTLGALSLDSPAVSIGISPSDRCADSGDFEGGLVELTSLAADKSSVRIGRNNTVGGSVTVCTTGGVTSFRLDRSGREVPVPLTSRSIFPGWCRRPTSPSLWHASTALSEGNVVLYALPRHNSNI